MRSPRFTGFFALPLLLCLGLLPGIAGADSSMLGVENWTPNGGPLPAGIDPGWIGTDPDGWLWISGGDHLAVVDPFGSATLLGPDQGLPAGTILDVAFHPELPRAVLAMDSGLYWFDALTLTFQAIEEAGAPARPPVAVAFHRNGSLFAASPGRSLLIRRGESDWSRVRQPGRRVSLLRTTPAGSVLAVSTSAVWLLGEEEPRRLGRISGRPQDLLSTGEVTWVLTDTDLRRFPAEETVLTLPDGWTDGLPLGLAADPQGDPGALWIATAREGLIRLNPTGTTRRFDGSEAGLPDSGLLGFHPAARGGFLAVTEQGLLGLHLADQPPQPFPAGNAGIAEVGSWEGSSPRTVTAALPRDHYQVSDAGYLLLSPGEGFDPVRSPVRISQDFWGNRSLELEAPMQELALALRYSSAEPEQVQQRTDWSAPSAFPPSTPVELMPYAVTEEDRLQSVRAKIRLSPDAWKSMQRATRELLATRFALQPQVDSTEAVESRTREAVIFLRGLGIPARLVRGAGGSLWAEAWCNQIGWMPLQAGAPATAWGSSARTSLPALLRDENLTTVRIGRDNAVPELIDWPEEAVTERTEQAPWDLMTRPSVLALLPTSATDEPPAGRFPLSPWLSLHARDDGNGPVRLVLRHEQGGIKLFEIPIQEWGQGRQINLPGAFALQFIPGYQGGVVILKVLSYQYEPEPPQQSRKPEPE